MLIHLHYTEPFDWHWMLRFLARRAVACVEGVQAEHYYRTLVIDGRSGWIRVAAQAGRLSVQVGGGLVEGNDKHRDTLIQCLSRLFDLDAEPALIAHQLAGLPSCNPGIRLLGSPCGFEFALRAIAEQQISTLAAVRLTGRLVARFGSPITTPISGLERLFPTPHQIAHASLDDIASVGLPRARARTLHTLACQVADGSSILKPPSDVDAGIKALQSLPGIGPWTAGYIAMRGWSARDVFLPTDHAVGKHFPAMKPKEIDAAGRAFSPFRSYAVLQMWEHGAPGA